MSVTIKQEERNHKTTEGSIYNYFCKDENGDLYCVATLYCQVCMRNMQAFRFFWLLGATAWVASYIQLQIKHLLCGPGHWQVLAIRHKIVRVAIPAQVTGSGTLESGSIGSQQNSAKGVIAMTECLARADGHLKLCRAIPQTGKNTCTLWMWVLCSYPEL